MRARPAKRAGQPGDVAIALFDAYRARGRSASAIEGTAGRACELDPLSPIATGYAGHALYKAGRYDEAFEHTHQTLSLFPNSFIHYFVLGYLYQRKGMYKKALQHFKKSVKLSRRASILVALLAHCYHDSGDKSRADTLLQELEERSRHEYVPPVAIFLIYHAIANQEKAVEWLQKAYDERCTFLPWYINNSDENYRIPRISPYLEIIEKTGLIN